MEHFLFLVPLFELSLLFLVLLAFSYHFYLLLQLQFVQVLFRFFPIEHFFRYLSELVRWTHMAQLIPSRAVIWRVSFARRTWWITPLQLRIIRGTTRKPCYWQMLCDQIPLKVSHWGAATILHPKFKVFTENIHIFLVLLTLVVHLKLLTCLLVMHLLQECVSVFLGLLTGRVLSFVFHISRRHLLSQTLGINAARRLLWYWLLRRGFNLSKVQSRGFKGRPTWGLQDFVSKRNNISVVLYQLQSLGSFSTANWPCFGV